MKSGLFAAWLAVPFAAAIASDGGASVGLIAGIGGAWMISALVLLELWHRREEAEHQRRLDACRRQSHKVG